MIEQPVEHSGDPSRREYDLVAAIEFIERSVPGKRGAFFFGLVYQRVNDLVDKPRPQRFRETLEALRFSEDQLFEVIDTYVEERPGDFHGHS